MKRLSWVVGLVVVALLAVGGYLAFKKRSGGDALNFDTTKVDRGHIVARVTATGTLSALVTVQVGSQVSGRIATLNADFNSQVKKGEILATIDPQLFEAALEQARANHAAAQANATKAKVQALDADRQFARAQSLAERKLIAQADLDTSQANAEAAHAQVIAANSSVEQSRASLHQAEVNLTYTTIKSPIDGVVISRSVDVGQTVAASLQAPTLFVIAEDLRKMQVDTSVSEADVGKLKPGMPASFSVDAYPNERFKGTVRQIRNAATTVQNVVTYDAVIDVENPELKLKPGMTANVTFIFEDRNDVLRVPNAALRFRPTPEMFARLAAQRAEKRGGGAPGEGQGHWRGQGGAGRAGGPTGGSTEDAAAPDKKGVWVLGEAGDFHRVPLSVGVSDGSMTEVVEGPLQEGDAVITDVTAPPGSSGGPGASPFGGPPAGGGMRRMGM